MAIVNAPFLWAYDVKQSGEIDKLDAGQLTSPIP